MTSIAEEVDASPMQKDALRALEGEPDGLKIHDVVDVIDRTPSETKALLNRLRNQGAVKRETANGEARYTIADEVYTDEPENHPPDAGGQETDDDPDQIDQEDSDQDDDELDVELGADEAIVGADENGKYHLDPGCGWSPDVDASGRVVPIGDVGDRSPCSSCGDVDQDDSDQDDEQLGELEDADDELDVALELTIQGSGGRVAEVLDELEEVIQ